MTSPSPRPPAPPGWPVGLAAAVVGGVLGTALRWAIVQAWPTGGGFPWTVLVVNVVGSAVLAALPLVPVVAGRPWLVVLLGTGACGGFTTMSTASVDGLGLLDDGHATAAVLYLAGTLAGALLAVALVRRVGARR